MNEELKAQLKQELKQEIKQERKKKRRIKLIVVFIILLILIIGWLVLVSKDNYKTKVISQEELEQYKKEISITKDNWKDYIVTEDTRTEIKDAFGKVTNIHEGTMLKLKDNICGYIILKVKVNNKDLAYLNTDEQQIVTIIGGSDDKNYNQLRTSVKTRTDKDIEIYNNRYTLNDLECIEVMGYLYTIDLPDNIWQTDKEGKQFFNLQSTSGGWYKCLKEDNEQDNKEGIYKYIHTLSSMEYEKYEKEIQNK